MNDRARTLGDWGTTGLLGLALLAGHAIPALVLTGLAMTSWARCPEGRKLSPVAQAA